MSGFLSVLIVNYSMRKEIFITKAEPGKALDPEQILR